MGIRSGVLTFRRYRVVGDLPDQLHSTFLEEISSRVHREIDLGGDQERSFGWTSPEDLLEPTIVHDQIFLADMLSLTFRVDTLRIPGDAMKIYVRRAEQERAAKLGKEKLSRTERDEVKFDVQRELRRRVLPSVKGYDFVWNLSTGVARFWTQNKTVCGLFEDFFRDTFGLRLVPRTPYTAIAEIGMDDAALERVLELDPADFVGVGE
jgi:hypothetical protein